MAIRISSKSKASSTSSNSKTEEDHADIGTMYELGEVFLTVRELSQRWKLSERHIRRLIAQARIPTVRFGRAVRIPESAVLDQKNESLS